MIHPEDILRPEGYDNPIIMSNKEFQKMKNLHNISKSITVTSKLNYIRFFCDGGDVYSREIIIGNENDEENRHITQYFKQEFNTAHITGLTKCAGQSNIVQVFTHEDMGLKIQMSAGELGDIIVYIKSKELIQEEDDDSGSQHSNNEQNEYVEKEEEEVVEKMEEMNMEENMEEEDEEIVEKKKSTRKQPKKEETEEPKKQTKRKKSNKTN